MSEVKTVKLWVCREVITEDAAVVALGAVRELVVKDLAEAEGLRLEFHGADDDTADSFVEGSEKQITGLLDKLSRLGLCGFTVDAPDPETARRLQAELPTGNEVAVVP